MSEYVAELGQELLHSITRVETLINETGDVVLIRDPYNNILDINLRDVDELFGYNVEELLNKPGSIRYADIKEYEHIEQMIRKNMHITHYKTQIISKDDKLVDVHLSLLPLTDPQGKNIGRVEIYKDISLISTLQRELKESYEKLNTAYVTLKELDHIKSEFIDIIAHELRTPLTAIIGYNDLLELNRDKNLTDKQKQYLQVIRRHAQELNKLVTDMLDVSSIETKQISLAIEPIEISGIVHDVLKKLEPLATERQLNITYKISDDLPIIRIDRHKISQTFFNLISNAIKYNIDNGKITITIEYRESKLYVEITDTGIGIPSYQLPEIFNPFYMGDASLTRETGKTGIGLYVAKGNVEIHGGSIGVESVEGLGSVFHFTLPVKE